MDEGSPAPDQQETGKSPAQAEPAQGNEPPPAPGQAPAPSPVVQSNWSYADREMMRRRAHASYRRRA
jgi:hypothetical protein